MILGIWVSGFLLVESTSIDYQVCRLKKKIVVTFEGLCIVTGHGMPVSDALS